MYVVEKDAFLEKDVESGKTHRCPDPDDPKKMKERLSLHTHIKTSNPWVMLLVLLLKTLSCGLLPIIRS